MLKRLAAAGMLTAALGGAMLTATPAMANDDDNTVNQEKVLEVNLLCNVGILAIQKDANCGGSTSALSDDDQANEINIHKHHKKRR
ncbi:hypothetical protein Acsp03_46510 [Actinomadura sp. NBRC 104412]|uniref:hypothetical protein n=1 Tax=Actinomadura sp. NBRC 104412 TaxID=3032203 RepID=UPI0024A03059|nr:hypothetical protein [Actinomadura sp. NBRC 104412]GLZ07185.1 hypothetical protein Acsp03_46510 [Actinomadura sp. NBRC 104412]